VRLTVWNFELPAKPSLASLFGLRHDRSSAACEMILRHKLMPIPVNAEDAGRFATEFGLEWFNLGFSSGATWDKAEMLEPPSVETIEAKAKSFPAGAMLYNYTADEIVRFPQHSGLESALGSHPCVALSSYQASPVYGSFSNQKSKNHPFWKKTALNPGGFGGQSPPSWR